MESNSVTLQCDVSSNDSLKVSYNDITETRNNDYFAVDMKYRGEFIGTTILNNDEAKRLRDFLIEKLGRDNQNESSIES